MRFGRLAAGAFFTVLIMLCREEKLIKIKGKPVIYKITEESLIENKLDEIQVDEVSANSVFPTPVSPSSKVCNPLGGYIIAALACKMHPFKLSSLPIL